MTVNVPKLNGYDSVIDCMPDKSMSIRAVLFNAIAEGSATVRRLLLSDDVLSAVDCMRRLGARVELDGDTAFITGAEPKSATLDCGNSGTAARLILGMLAGLPGTFTLDGDASLRSRPMKRVTEPLAMMGAKITTADGRLPATVEGGALGGLDYELPVASAQVKSALLLAGLNAGRPVTVREKVRSRDHTENMLAEMNADIRVDGNAVTVRKSTLRAHDFTVPGDISSATYPICLALMSGGHVIVKNVGINKTRTGLLDVLSAAGADIKLNNVTAGAEPAADIEVTGGALVPFEVSGALVPRLIDEIPALCALACFIDGTTVIKDAAELRVKETDRIKTTAAALSALGADIVPTDDGMIIHGGKPLHFGEVDSCLDHRIAMSAAIAGAAADGVRIINGDCASVSYPNFYGEVLGV